MARAAIAAACIIGILSFAGTTPLAQERKKVPVFISATVTDDDQLGRLFTFEIKEAIRGSHGFRLVDNDLDWPYIRYSFVSQKRGDAEITLAHVFTYDSADTPLSGALITYWIQSCGSSMIQACARRMLGNLDAAVESLGKRSPKMLQTLR